jgi:glycosyltransferase involved in cell wall biosynthesis
MTEPRGDSLHVCLICIEFFGDSIYGGFGRATRFIGRELARRGVTVSVVVPRRSADRPDRYELDGVRVHQYDPRRPWHGLRVLKALDADIYHSQDTSLTTLLAQIARPRAAHVITFRDPMDSEDWQIETVHAGLPKVGWAQYRYFIDNPLVGLAVRRADSLHCAARFLEDKCARIYGPARRPRFLPTPVDIPPAVRKAHKPTVCYIGRWEGRKRVELFFELARSRPDVDFIAVGAARDPQRDQALRAHWGDLPNLRMTGVLDQFSGPELSAVLGTSWILVNTSLREGLPTTFIEAAAHRCAILSFTDPDGFASRFGVRVQEGALPAALEALLRDDRWKVLGEAGFRHVGDVFAVDQAMNEHLRLYAQLAASVKRRT